MTRRIRRSGPWFGAVAALLLLALPVQADDIEPDPYADLDPYAEEEVAVPEPEAEVEVEVEEEARTETTAAASKGPGIAAKIFDCAVLRPLGFVATILGVGMFVPAAALTSGVLFLPPTVLFDHRDRTLRVAGAQHGDTPQQAVAIAQFHLLRGAIVGRRGFGVTFPPAKKPGQRRQQGPVLRPQLEGAAVPPVGLQQRAAPLVEPGPLDDRLHEIGVQLDRPGVVWQRCRVLPEFDQRHAQPVLHDRILRPGLLDDAQILESARELLLPQQDQRAIQRAAGADAAQHDLVLQHTVGEAAARIGFPRALLRCGGGAGTTETRVDLRQRRKRDAVVRHEPRSLFERGESALGVSLRQPHLPQTAMGHRFVHGQLDRVG